MFWRFGGYANISTIDTILDKPDFTLEELLDESDLIQELKQHNSKLIEYLREDNILEKLLEYVVAPRLEVFATPDDPTDDEAKGKSRLLPFSRPRASSRATDVTENDEEEQEKRRNRYALVASEVLSSDTWSIYEALTENRDLVRKFWKFLERPAPLDPLQASYFTKVNESLFEKKTDDMMELFRTIPNVVPELLKHVECPMIMDLLLKVIALDRNEGGQGIVEVRKSSPLPACILSHPTQPHTSHTNLGMLDLRSGSTRKTLFLRCFPASTRSTVGLCRRQLVTLSKPSLPSLPTPHKTNNNASAPTSSPVSWYHSPALNSSSVICSEEATPLP